MGKRGERLCPREVRSVYLLAPSGFLSCFMSLLFLALSHFKHPNISQLQLLPRVQEGLPSMQDLVIVSVYGVGDTAMLVGSSRRTGMSFPSGRSCLETSFTCA